MISPRKACSKIATDDTNVTAAKLELEEAKKMLKQLKEIRDLTACISEGDAKLCFDLDTVNEKIKELESKIKVAEEIEKEASSGNKVLDAIINSTKIIESNNDINPESKTRLLNDLEELRKKVEAKQKQSEPQPEEANQPKTEKAKQKDVKYELTEKEAREYLKYKKTLKKANEQLKAVNESINGPEDLDTFMSFMIPLFINNVKCGNLKTEKYVPKLFEPVEPVRNIDLSVFSR